LLLVLVLLCCSDILSHVMKGLHLSFSESNLHQETHDSPWPQPHPHPHPHSKGQGTAAGTGDDPSSAAPLPLSHEEYCLSLREKFLLSYFDQFQFDIEKLRPEVCSNHLPTPHTHISSCFAHFLPMLCLLLLLCVSRSPVCGKVGIVRKEARLTFLRRFIESLELSLSKLDAIVVGTSSSLGRTTGTHSNNGGGGAGPTGSASCIACDRPLRMRVTSTPLGKLHSRVVHNQELSPKSKRKQLQTQQHLHTSSATHQQQHTSSAGFGSGGKKKGGLQFGGMTFPISSVNAGQSSPMDAFESTLNLNSRGAISEEVSGSLQEDNEQQQQNQGEGEDQGQGQGEEGEEEEDQEKIPPPSPTAQSTSVLANELRKLVKLSSSTPQLPSSSSSALPSSASATALSGYSKSSARGQPQANRRPKSAGPAGHLPNSSAKIKPTQLTYGGPAFPSHTAPPAASGVGAGEELVPRYVKKGGFKMRANKTMPQERLVENLSKNYFQLQDQSFPQTQTQPHRTAQGQGMGTGTQVFFPSSGPGDLNNSSDGIALNLSSVSQPTAEAQPRDKR
jgi:hypothetical protein